jgi:hypothetical protein
MTGWNLPPGVNVNDIPGNRPEDMIEEAFWEALAQKLDEKQITTIKTSTGSTDETVISLDDLWDDPQFVQIIEIARDMGFDHGYGQGQSDEAIAGSSLEAAIDEELQDWFFENQEVTARTYLAKRAEIRHKLTKKN